MRLSFSALKKITFGFMTAAAAMVWAAGSYDIFYCSLHSSHSAICDQSYNITFTRQIHAATICRLVTRFLPSSPGFKLDRKQRFSLSFLLVLMISCPASGPFLSPLVRFWSLSLVSSTPSLKHPTICGRWSCLSTYSRWHSRLL